MTRLRLGLEGTWRGLVIGNGTLAPRLELGVRHDGGDAETGFGLDLGGGLAWSDPATGIRAAVSGARPADPTRAPGSASAGSRGSFGWDPDAGLGPGSEPGAEADHGGLGERRRGRAAGPPRPLAGLAANDDGDELDRRRLELRLGYGFGALGDRFTATPEAGFGMSQVHRDYSLAWRLVRDRRGR